MTDAPVLCDKQASRARAVARRAQREAAAEEADRHRKVAAQAKLAELEERIARRCARLLGLFWVVF